MRPIKKMKGLFRDNELMVNMKLVWGIHAVIAIGIVAYFWYPAGKIEAVGPVAGQCENLEIQQMPNHDTKIVCLDKEKTK